MACLSSEIDTTGTESARDSDEDVAHAIPAVSNNSRAVAAKDLFIVVLDEGFRPKENLVAPH